MRDPGVPVVIALCALAAALLLPAPFLYNASFPGAHLWTFVAVSVGGSLVMLGVLGALYLGWDWIRGRGKARAKADKESRHQEQIRRIKVEQQEGRRLQRAEHDLVLRELQARKFNAIAQAEHGSTSIAAGRDVNNYYTAPATQQERPPVSDEPTFDLTFRAAPDDFVHALVTNKTTPAEFHVDVIEVVAEETQTTPYPVKWRGFAGEDRRIVREALIDLAEVITPGRNRDGGGIVVINPYKEKSGYWESGYFRLFSFSKQDGWATRGVDTQAADVADEFRFFRERISLTVRATRLDTQEEITRRVTISFVAPTLDERSRQWIEGETAYRVEAEDTIDPVGDFNELIEQGRAIGDAIYGDQNGADPKDETFWRVRAELAVGAYCDASRLTDFKTARHPDRPRTGAMVGNWDRLHRLDAQVEVLRSCRDALAPKSPSIR